MDHIQTYLSEVLRGRENVAREADRHWRRKWVRGRERERGKINYGEGDYITCLNTQRKVANRI